jgi:hypothetical protein
MTNRTLFNSEAKEFCVNGYKFEKLPNGIKNTDTGQTFVGHVGTYTDAIGIEFWMRKEPTRKEFRDNN